MIPRIKKLQPKEGFRLLVEFDDGKRVIYDVNSDINDIPSYQDLRTINCLFNSVQLDASRTCVFWTDDIDLPSDIIYEYGESLN